MSIVFVFTLITVISGNPVKTVSEFSNRSDCDAAVAEKSLGSPANGVVFAECKAATVFK